MIKRLMLATIAAAAMAAAAPALAQTTQADSPWHGWYVGLNAGGNWGHGSQRLSAEPGNGSVVIPPADETVISNVISNTNPAGFTGGIEGGYNYMYRSNPAVIGIETDFSAFNLDQTVTKTFQPSLMVNPPPATPPTATVSQHLKTDWLWTLRPRVGWAPGRWLLYATGGMAVGEVKQTASYSDNLVPPNAASLVGNETKVGWTVGAGVGYALSSNWSIKAEYLYVDLGRISASAASPGGYLVLGSSGQIRSSIVRAGVDYKFW